MSAFEKLAIERLTSTAEAIMAAPLPSAVTDAAWRVVAEAGDIEGTARDMLRLILAAEDAATVAAGRVAVAKAEEAQIKAAAASARAALLQVIEETGLPLVATEHHSAAVSNSGRSVVITDAAALPGALLRFPPPEPARDKIRAALLAGESIPGAHLSNGAPALRITARKD